MYKTGTIAVTNGSAIVTGAGTLWVDAGVLNAGDLIFCPDGTLQEVLSFQSNTQLTLAGDGHGNTVYLGATLAGQAYGIVPIGMLPSSLALQVKTTLNAAQAAIGSAVLTTAAQGLTATQQTNARTNISALGASDVGKGLLVKSAAGGVDVVLTAAEAANQFIELTGALTANIKVVVPNAARLFVIRNSMTGAYTVTVTTAAGTGVTALQGGRMLIECDGTNCVDALSFMRQTGGSIDGTPIGSTTPAAVAATTLSASGALTTAGLKEDASGNFLIGTTVSTVPVENSYQWINSAGAARFNHSTANSTGDQFAGFFYNGGGIGSITQSGTTAVLYNTTSDYRLKANPRPLTGSGAFVDALEPTTWEWTRDGKTDSGFLAHRFQLVSPNSVNGVKDEMEVQTYEVSPSVPATQDAEGVELTPAIPAVMGTRTVPKYQSMQASSAEVIANLVAELQDLRRRLAAAGIA